MKLYLNARDDQTSFNKKHFLLRAAKRMGLEDVVLDGAIQTIEKKEYILNIEPFKDFQVGSKWTGIWEIDVMLDRAELSLSNWVVCDTVFVANNNIPSRMKFGGKQITLFQACDPVLHRRMSEIDQQYDFVLSGTTGMKFSVGGNENGGDIYEGRSRTIETLIKAGFSFHDYGKGYVPEEYVKKINTAKVQFIRSGAKPPFTSQVEQRFFECLSIGPVLKDYHPDLEYLGLTEGVDYFHYKNDGEMLAKMKILVENPEFSRKMAENGRRKAITYHSYEARLGSILANIYDKI